MDIGNFIIAAIVFFVALILWKKFFVKVTVLEYEKGMVFADGKFSRIADAGAFWIHKASTQVFKVDMRPRLLQIMGQEVMTSDGVGLKISVAGQFKVVDPKLATLSADSYYGMLYMQLQLALRDIISGITMDDLMEKRANIGEQLLSSCSENAKQLGLELSSIAVKDIMLTGELKRAFTQVMKAKKEGQAALERARGESAALRNLANAAKVIENNPALMQLRALQAFSESGGNTLVLGMPANAFPVPIKAGSAPEAAAPADSTESHD